MVVARRQRPIKRCENKGVKHDLDNVYLIMVNEWKLCCSIAMNWFEVINNEEINRKKKYGYLPFAFKK